MNLLTTFHLQMELSIYKNRTDDKNPYKYDVYYLTSSTKCFIFVKLIELYSLPEMLIYQIVEIFSLEKGRRYIYFNNNQCSRE
jgi:hypothetical protein